MATAKKVEKKEAEKMKFAAVVMETQHGGLFNRHIHHDIEILEVPVGLDADDVGEAANSAAEIARKVMGVKSRILVAKDVEIRTSAHIKERGDQIKKRLGFAIN